jgi:hypothetical protein
MRYRLCVAGYDVPHGWAGHTGRLATSVPYQKINNVEPNILRSI